MFCNDRLIRLMNELFTGNYLVQNARTEHAGSVPRSSKLQNYKFHGAGAAVSWYGSMTIFDGLNYRAFRDHACLNTKLLLENGSNNSNPFDAVF